MPHVLGLPKDRKHSEKIPSEVNFSMLPESAVVKDEKHLLV